MSAYVTYYPSQDEVDEIWANMTDEDKQETLDNLPDWYKEGIEIASLKVDEISGKAAKSAKAHAVQLFGQLAQIVDGDVSMAYGTIKITRPKTDEEMVKLAKSHISDQMARKAREAAEEANAEPWAHNPAEEPNAEDSGE